MNASAPPKAPQKPVPPSLDELKTKLSNAKRTAQELATQTTENNQLQDSLQKNIDVIAKNVAEFTKDGEALKTGFSQSQQQLDTKLDCVTKCLGDCVDEIDAVIDKVNEEISSQETSNAGDEPSIAGELDVTARGANRSASKKQAAFDLLIVKAIKDRLQQSQALLKEASGITGDSPADHARVYVLLKLASDRLHWSVLSTETGSERIEFSLPNDATAYEAALVAAYDQIKPASDAAATARAAFEAKKAEFDLGVKHLGDLRNGRKEKILAQLSKLPARCR